MSNDISLNIIIIPLGTFYNHRNAIYQKYIVRIQNNSQYYYVSRFYFYTFFLLYKFSTRLSVLLNIRQFS